MSATTLPIAKGNPSGLAQAAQEVWIIWVGLFALGIGFGVLVTAHGLPWWLAPIISASMFAGSVEFLLIGMLAAGTPIATIALTTLLINSRHLFYGLTFPLHRVRGRLAKAYTVFALCDEAYAILTSKDPATLSAPGSCGPKSAFTPGGRPAPWSAACSERHYPATFQGSTSS